MKKGKLIFGIFGILAVCATIAATVLGLLLNFNTAVANSSGLQVFGQFWLHLFQALVGREGHTFPQSLFLIVSFALGALFVFIGLAWIIVALCKKKFVGILYGFATILAAAVISFGLFVYVPNGVKEIYKSFEYTYDFTSNYFCDFCVYASIAASALILFAFIAFVVAYSLKEKNEYKVAVESSKANAEETSAQLVVEETREEEAVTETPVEEAKEETPAETALEEPKTEEHAEETPVETSKEETKVEEAPVKEEPETKETTKTNNSKPKAKQGDKKEQKPVAKKESKPVAKKEAKSTAKKETKSAAKKDTSEGEKEVYKAYHVSQHPDGGWQVKGAGSDKALKRFKTQAEAIKYAKEVSASQGTTYLVHSMKGKLRKA